MRHCGPPYLKIRDGVTLLARCLLTRCWGIALRSVPCRMGRNGASKWFILLRSRSSLRPTGLWLFESVIRLVGLAPFELPPPSLASSVEPALISRTASHLLSNLVRSLHTANSGPGLFSFTR